MTNPRDVVAVMRSLANGLVPLAEQHALRMGADEIERLRSELESCRCQKILSEEESSQYMRQRDDARREVCALDADTSEDQREYAAQRGWHHLFAQDDPKP